MFIIFYYLLMYLQFTFFVVRNLVRFRFLIFILSIHASYKRYLAMVHRVQRNQLFCSRLSEEGSENCEIIRKFFSVIVDVRRVGLRVVVFTEVTVFSNHFL